MHRLYIHYRPSRICTSFERVIYSSLFRKYGRQLNRKNTATEKVRGHIHQTQNRRQMLGNKTSIINKFTVSNHNDHATQ